MQTTVSDMPKIVIIFLIVYSIVLIAVSSCADNQNISSVSSSLTDIIIIDAPPPVQDIQKNFYPEATEDTRRLNDYTITLDIENPKTGIVTGIEKLSYKNRSGMDMDKMYFKIYMKTYSLHDEESMEFEKSVKLKELEEFEDPEVEGSYINIKKITLNDDEVLFNISDNVITVYFNEVIKDQEICEFSLQFEAYVNEGKGRTGSNDHAVWFGNFLPIAAVYDSDGWHTEPYYDVGHPYYANISKYSLKINTPEGYAVVGSGESVFNESDGKRQTVLTAKMVRDFAFVVSDQYNVVTVKTNSDISVNVYSYSDTDEINTVNVVALDSLDYLSDMLSGYPYQSLNIVETELPTQTVIGYPAMIFIDSDFLRSGNFNEALASAIVRQWFGNSIGSNQIKEPWFIRGLTSLIVHRILYDDMQIAQNMDTEYSRINNNNADIVLCRDLSYYSGDKQAYENMLVKAELMLYELSLKMGEDTFYQLLKTFYSKYSFNLATSEDFKAMAEELYGESLSDFFETWLTESEIPILETDDHIL